MYFFQRINILRINRIRLKNGDKRIGYCTNRGLIYAIRLIGIYYSRDEGNKPYKSGIDYVKQYLAQVHNIYVSKAEIKSAMRPCRKRKHMLKISSNICEIVKTVKELVDNKDFTHWLCIEKNNEYACIYKVHRLGCYQHLVGNLINQLRIIKGALAKGSNLEDIYGELEGDKSFC